MKFTVFDDGIGGITGMSAAAIPGPDHNEAHRQAMLNDLYPNLCDTEYDAENT